MMTKTLPFLLLLVVQNVFAWGTSGHKIVAQIAENNLKPAAKARIQALLSGVSLADVSTWADSIRGRAEWKFTSTWHYVNIPDGLSYEDSDHDTNGDVITAITELTQVLKDKTANSIDQQSALKLIVHFVGDIHQPLHVGKSDDRGGNNITVVYEGKSVNLHSLWDSVLINKQNMGYTEYARYLENQFRDPSNEGEAFSFKKIVSESMKSRPMIYDFSLAFFEPIILTNTYLGRNLNNLNNRLFLGGKRLANLLNSIYQ